MQEMRRASVFATTFLTAAVFAGCLAAEVEHTSAAPESSTEVLEPAVLLLSDCLRIGGRFPLPASFVGSSLPEGFEPEPEDPAGLFVPGWLLGMRCNDAEANGKKWREFAWMEGTWAVRPPERYRSPEVSVYLMADGGMVTDPETWRLLDSWGFGGQFFNGTLGFVDAAPAGLVTATYDKYRMDVAWSVLDAPEDRPPETWRLFVANYSLAPQQATLVGAIDIHVGSTTSLQGGVAWVEGTAMDLPWVSTWGLPGTGVHDSTDRMVLQPVALDIPVAEGPKRAADAAV